MSLEEDSTQKKHYHGHRNRLRKRFLEKPDSLTHYECLELLLGYAFPRGDTKPIAKALLERSGGFLYPLFDDPEQTAVGELGLTEYQYTLIKLARHLTARVLKETLPEASANGIPRLAEWTQTLFMEAPNEKFLVLFLNTKNHVMAHEFQSEGTVNQAAVYPRRVMERALFHHAAAIILAHNHPSGDTRPSREDIQITLQIRRAGETLGIAVHDHLIIGRNQYYSMAYEGDI